MVLVIIIIMGTIFQMSALCPAFNPSSDDRGRFYYPNVTDGDTERCDCLASRHTASGEGKFSASPAGRTAQQGSSIEGLGSSIEGLGPQGSASRGISSPKHRQVRMETMRTLTDGETEAVGR